MRAFIAIDFSRELKKQIADFQSGIRRYAFSGRWKHTDNFHLTLKFLGEINPGKADEINRELDEIRAKTGVFRLRINELGYFPGKDCMRVLWLGLGGDLDKLNALQAAIEAGMSKLGFEKEKRRYIPHITIAQDVRLERDFEEIRKIFHRRTFDEIIADKVYLVKSEQIGQKRVYTPIAEHRCRPKCFKENFYEG